MIHGICMWVYCVYTSTFENELSAVSGETLSIQWFSNAGKEDDDMKRAKTSSFLLDIISQDFLRRYRTNQVIKTYRLSNQTENYQLPRFFFFPFFLSSYSSVNEAEYSL